MQRENPRLSRTSSELPYQPISGKFYVADDQTEFKNLVMKLFDLKALYIKITLTLLFFVYLSILLIISRQYRIDQDPQSIIFEISEPETILPIDKIIYSPICIYVIPIPISLDPIIGIIYNEIKLEIFNQNDTQIQIQTFEDFYYDLQESTEEKGLSLIPQSQIKPFFLYGQINQDLQEGNYTLKMFLMYVNKTIEITDFKVELIHMDQFGNSGNNFISPFLISYMIISFMYALYNIHKLRNRKRRLKQI